MKTIYHNPKTGKNAGTRKEALAETKAPKIPTQPKLKAGVASKEAMRQTKEEKA